MISLFQSVQILFQVIICYQLIIRYQLIICHRKELDQSKFFFILRLRCFPFFCVFLHFLHSLLFIITSMWVKSVFHFPGYFSQFSSSWIFFFSSSNHKFSHTNSETQIQLQPSNITSQLQSKLHPFHPSNATQFRTDFTIPIYNFDYQLLLIKPWFLLCVLIVYFAPLVTFGGYTYENSK